VVVTKSGKQTHGLDRFFSLAVWQSRPGLCFLRLSLISVKRRTSYPVMMEPIDKAPTNNPPDVSKKKSLGNGDDRKAAKIGVDALSSCHPLSVSSKRPSRASCS